MPEHVPGPKPWPIIGNLLDVQGEVPVRAVEKLCDTHGPFIQLRLGGINRLFVGGFEVFDELCDETRFFKSLPPALADGIPGTRGLFASLSEKEPDWAQAHRILMPAFGPLAIQNMFAEMYDISSQLAMKWARLGLGHTMCLTDDFTRLSLDTIALCTMDYRFNSFYSDSMHPYVKAMTSALASLSQKNQIGEKLKILLQPSYESQVERDLAFMNKVGNELVQHRRDNPTHKPDLLNAMVHGRDPKTGEPMRDGLIAANMRTFLVAGHETTSGLLSFAFMYMLLNPSTLVAAQREVDRVVGTGRIELHHLNELPYLTAVLRETLRLVPPAPGFGRSVRPENKEEVVTIAGGKYEIPRGISVFCLLGKIQRDPKVWGVDAEEFRPDRMLDENFNKLPKNAWKPFGTGLRACIGRAFAWQEALLAMSMVLQNFDLSLADPDYKMEVQQALTIKPKNTHVHVKLRPGLNSMLLMQRLMGGGALLVPSTTSNRSSMSSVSSTASISSTSTGATAVSVGEARPCLTILYGSNTGTCQSLAQMLAAEAGQRGLKATTNDLDDAVESITTGGHSTTIIITASYEGQAPDNASRFMAWLESIEGCAAFAGTRFAVFGCGHTDWPATYQKIPSRIDTLLAQSGATRVAERGVADASQKDMYGDFTRWTEGVLWPALSSTGCPFAATGKPYVLPPVTVPTMDIVVSTEQRSEFLQQKLVWATVANVRRLTASGQPEKRHIEFQLPAGTPYATGDYLAVLPLNPEDDIRRVTQRFRLPHSAVITIKRDRGLALPTLPTDTPVSLAGLLRGYVELSMPATRKDIQVLASLAEDEAEHARLQTLLDNASAFAVAVTEQRTSLLDLLEQNPRVSLPLASFLVMLPPIRTRQYSIASSPLISPDTCALCYSVIDEPAWSCPERRFRGVTGAYLGSLRAGDQALVAVRAANPLFRLPRDPESTPALMVCAGAGLAPFRAFLQERAVQILRQGRKLAPAVLFVGCRFPDTDRLYADEIDGWVRDGVVDVRYAFSQAPEHPLAGGCRYSPERLLYDKDSVLAQWDAGAKVYTCGTKQIAKDVGATMQKLLFSRVCDGDGEAAARVADQHMDRIVTDVFS
ncbi:bifunctional p-450 nadph-p450 reductase [Ophiostoma piceae UAMH 11346]|uniref:Bifunctional cytochrome P450/NADPH--P450 reductase n=1 Tax=Ophiostoma piceae (strain UAMH 11346) TaxID=1262450 RepID=S3BVB6_OPHP1|nr:bifunctional p-450 nadph-p450 reductase [Ophiostoma piceae UAMH 11346]